jgi:hypothetical protein
MVSFNSMVFGTALIVKILFDLSEVSSLKLPKENNLRNKGSWIM